MAITQHATANAQHHWPVSADQRGESHLVVMGQKARQQLPISHADCIRGHDDSTKLVEELACYYH